MREPKKLIVKVYRNLHIPGVMWSVRGPDDKILTHAKSVLLRNATFIVQPAGREKVRREKKKTVHAFVKGELIIDPSEAYKSVQRINKGYSQSVYYNPYKNDEFITPRGPIESAEEILIASSKGCPELLATGIKV